MELTIQHANRIVRLRAQGFKINAIAEKLGIPERTVYGLCVRTPDKPRAKTEREKHDARERREAIEELLREGRDPAVIKAVFG